MNEFVYPVSPPEIDPALNAKYRALFDQGMLFMGFTDLDGHVVEVNRLALEYCGYRRDEVIGKLFWETGWWRGSDALREQIHEAWHEALAGHVFRRDLPYQLADGTQRMVDFSMFPITDSSGTTLFLAPVGMDITDRVRAERLVESQMRALEMLSVDAPLTDILAFLAQTVERQFSLPEVRVALLLLDDAGERYLMAVAPSLPPDYAAAVSGLAPGFDPHRAEAVANGWPIAIDTAASGDELITRLVESTGLTGYVHGWMQPVLSPQARALGVLVLYADAACRPDAAARGLLRIVTHLAALAIERLRARDEIAARSRQLAQLAHFDILTGLPNRAMLIARIEHALHAAASRPGMAAVLFVDLDRFKWVNDEYGHQTGDALLHEVAQRLRATTRSSDNVGRLGGDEFLVILEAVDSAHDARVVAQKLVAALAMPYTLGGRELVCTASVGIGLYPTDGDHVEALIAAADMAMYSAKQNGRNAALTYRPEMIQRRIEQADTGRALRRALYHGQLLLHYQPLYQLDSGNISGVEALLRWQHPERGLLGAPEFVPIAEESGFIVDIGTWALRQACREARNWRCCGTPVRVAVNVSVLQLKHGNLIDNVQRALADYDFAPERLELEITENALQYEHESLTALRALDRLGIRVAIDDFGTGYSCLASIKHLPLYRLKIDHAFVRDIITDANDAAITDTIIAMAHRLNLKVTAEGVETPAQMEFLRARGCDEVQGFLLGRPMPAKDMAALLKRSKKMSG
jgi:diguanylate cyclase (GGDEF)-like protein/PAS domain S-box-containing protein